VKTFFVICIIMSCSCIGFGQSASLLLGATGNGMGNTTACSGNEWSLLNNIGGLSQIEQSSVAFTHHFYPSMAAFSRSAFVLTVPVATGAAGVSLFRFGDELYNEQVYTVGFSNELGIASLGIALRYIQYSGEGFGTRGVVAASFGGIAKINKVLTFGAYITNINQPEVSRGVNKQTIPARVAAGLSLQASERVLTALELEKELGSPITVKGGFSYDIGKKVFFRTGFNLQPDAAFAGFGFKPRRISIDYAAEYQLATGIRHQMSVGYKFLKK
jgi:hypothetical protein